MTAVPSIKIADERDRARAFRRARINTFFVRTVRTLLPIGAVGLLGFYIVFMQRTVRSETATQITKIDPGALSGSPDNLAMANPSYEGYNKKDGSRFKVSAKKAITDLSRNKPIKLQEIIGAFEQLSGQKTNIKATRGVFDQKTGTLELEGGIDVRAPNGLRVVLNKAKIDTKTAVIASDQPVLVQTPAAEVRSNAMRLDQQGREIVFDRGVAAQLRPSSNQSASQKRAASLTGGSDEVKPASTKPPSIVPSFGGGSTSPVNITAASLVIAEKKRTAEFKGNVTAIQDGRRLKAPKLVVAFEGGTGFANLARVAGGAGGAATPNGRLRQIIARDGVELIDDGNRITAQTAIFDTEAKKAELIGKIKIEADRNGVITADHAGIETETNKIVLTGKVIAKQTSNLLRGRRLVYQPKQGRMRLTSPGLKGAPSSQIFVRFRRADGARRNRPRRQARSGGGAMSFNTDPNAPIEISARSLDVRDPRSTARFEGGVRARQGNLVLTTPVLTASYSGRLGLMNESGKTGSKRRKRAPMKLRIIRATKPVRVTSGGDMQADGEQAEFDMLANTVTISGNVVLRQGRQIVRGDRLIIDLKTGLSRMKNAGPERNQRKPLTFGAAPNITSNPGQRDCGGQMCAVFFPGDVQKRAKKKKAPATAARSSGNRPRLGSGWTTRSTN